MGKDRDAASAWSRLEQAEPVFLKKRGGGIQLPILSNRPVCYGRIPSKEKQKGRSRGSNSKNRQPKMRGRGPGWLAVDRKGVRARKRRKGQGYRGNGIVPE